MEGIALFILIAIIGVVIYFLQLPIKLYSLSKDVLWIWPLLIVGCYILIKYLCGILVQYEPYPHFGNYILISIAVAWGYFFLNIRISPLDELDNYQYYDDLYDSYEDRTPFQICSLSE